MPNYLQSAQDGLVVDINNQGGVQSGSPLQALVMKSENNQYWTTQDVPGKPGYFWIVSADLGLVIDINNQGGVQSGSSLQALEKKNEANQWWTWVPTTLTFGVPDTGFGSGPTNANFSASLTLNSDGTVSFAGQYQDTGSIPVFDAPAQSYNVAAGVLASNNVVYTFSHSSPSVPTGGQTDAWGPQSFLNSLNPAPNTSEVMPAAVHSEIASAWASIAQSPQCTFKANNNSDLGGLLSEIVSWAETIVSDAVQVVEVVAAVAA
jgi:hypothetical protein